MTSEMTVNLTFLFNNSFLPFLSKINLKMKLAYTDKDHELKTSWQQIFSTNLQVVQSHPFTVSQSHFSCMGADYCIFLFHSESVVSQELDE